MTKDERLIGGAGGLVSSKILHHGFSTGGYVKLLVNVSKMASNRVETDGELIGYLLVAEALGQEVEDLKLPL